MAVNPRGLGQPPPISAVCLQYAELVMLIAWKTKVVKPEGFSFKLVSFLTDFSHYGQKNLLSLVDATYHFLLYFFGKLLDCCMRYPNVNRMHAGVDTFSYTESS